jgi:DNA polymerase (family 10)
MALTAKELGYEYIAICDHSKTAFYANGLTEDRVKAQHEEIEKLNEEGIGIRILKGIESDILADGSLDYSDAVLESFDLIVASVHSQFTMPRDVITARIVNAVRNPFTTILGHPTGRLLLAREGYAVDIDAVLEAAAETNTVVEINANPYRLDLAWPHVRKAQQMGIRLAINPDAHHPDELRYVRYGIGIARKGMLAAKSVVNTFSLAQFEAEVLRRTAGR